MAKKSKRDNIISSLDFTTLVFQESAYEYTIGAVSGANSLGTSIAYDTSSSAWQLSGSTMVSMDSGISSILLEVTLSGADTGYFSSIIGDFDYTTIPLTSNQVLSFYTIFNNDRAHVANETYDVRFLVSALSLNMDSASDPASGTYGIDNVYSDSYTLTALGDAVAPTGLTGFTATGQINQVVLNWTNPSVSDLSAVQIQYSTVSAVTDHTNGTTLFKTTSALEATTTQSGLTAYVPIYYSAFAVDTLQNWSAAVTAVATPIYNEYWGRGALIGETVTQTRGRFIDEGII